MKLRFDTPSPQYLCRHYATGRASPRNRVHCVFSFGFVCSVPQYKLVDEGTVVHVLVGEKNTKIVASRNRLHSPLFAKII